MKPTTKWYIKIDCWPGIPRPEDIFDACIQGLNLDKTSTDTAHRFMGEWQWDFTTTEEQYGEVFPEISKRLRYYYQDDNGTTQVGMRYYAISEAIEE
tara:strand:+ start:88 stop:378 length:291 start_codon:yes stop_codon:yes gene_type:complete